MAGVEPATSPLIGRLCQLSYMGWRSMTVRYVDWKLFRVFQRRVRVARRHVGPLMGFVTVRPFPFLGSAYPSPTRRPSAFRDPAMSMCDVERLQGYVGYENKCQKHFISLP